MVHLFSMHASCSATFSLARSPRAHRSNTFAPTANATHSSDPVACDVCGISCKYFGSFSRHKLRTHVSGAKKYHCHQESQSCDKSYLTSSVKPAFHRSQDIFYLRCVVSFLKLMVFIELSCNCELLYVSHSQKICFLDGHRLQFHGDPTLNPFRCEVENCRRTFTSKSSLKVHDLVHSKAYQFWCEICGRGKFTKLLTTNQKLTKIGFFLSTQSEIGPTSQGPL